jgi:hypothetical protein
MGGFMSKSVEVTPGTGRLLIKGKPPDVRLLERLPDEHPLYALIGRVASEWAHLEHFLDLIIWEMSGTDPVRGSCITAQLMGATPRYNTIIALCTAMKLSDKILGDVDELRRKSYDVQELRNRIIHDPWYVVIGTGKTAQFRSMPRSDLIHGFKDIDINEINNIFPRIHRRIEMARDLRIAISAEIATPAAYS